MAAKTAKFYAEYDTVHDAIAAFYPQNRVHRIDKLIKAVEKYRNNTSPLHTTKKVTFYNRHSYMDPMKLVTVRVPTWWDLAMCRVAGSFICNLPGDAVYVRKSTKEVLSDDAVILDNDELVAYMDGGPDHMMVYVSCSASQANKLLQFRIVSLLRIWISKNATMKEFNDKLCARMRLFTPKHRDKIALYLGDTKLVLNMESLETAGIHDNDTLTLFWGKSGPAHGHSTTPLFSYATLKDYVHPQTVKERIALGADKKALMSQRGSNMKKVSRQAVFNKTNFAFGEEADYAGIDMDGYRIVLHYSSSASVAAFGEPGKRFYGLFGWELGHFNDWIDGGIDEECNIFPQSTKSNDINEVDRCRRRSIPGERALRSVWRKQETVAVTAALNVVDYPPLPLPDAEVLVLVNNPKVETEPNPLLDSRLQPILVDARLDKPQFRGLVSKNRPEERQRAFAAAFMNAYNAGILANPMKIGQLTQILHNNMPMHGKRREISEKVVHDVLKAYGF